MLSSAVFCCVNRLTVMNCLDAFSSTDNPPVEAIHTLPRAVGEQVIDKIAAAITFITVIVYADGVSVEAVEAMLSAHPDITVMILCNGIAAPL